ncbi:hypothetical protein VL20_4227 [Microcystis panniformis FACHB-1757]|uniref:Uncharacterized protein n=1 Tax=Microcystis panniformis FACHB-1757 TaxID=1638788 RepID=A0A0K1S5B6_9CHRO|nr:hypothetical protein VL20_4227 [Microcystis panniformis FACHB-1757]
MGWIGAIFLAPKLPRPPGAGGSIDYRVGSRFKNRYKILPSQL